MALNKKPNLYDDPATAWFMEQSKAALADIATELLRLQLGECDTPASREAAEAMFGKLIEERKGLKSIGRMFDAPGSK
jgi:hypothetical protein